MRVTLQTLQILRALLDDPAGEHYGLELARNAGLPTGSVYPILTRLESAGLVTSAWEDIDQAVEGRRRRRYYRLSPEGADFARTQIRQAQRSLNASQSRLRPGGATA